MLSVVIPALNAAGTITACLASVAEAGERVVVDGGSSDATAQIAAGEGAHIVASERGRGRQLHAGALAARGEWLLFLHADTRLAANWRSAAEAHIARQSAAHEQAACFRFRLDDGAWQARLIEAGVAARVRLLALPYGDQGLLISRRLYDEIGGYRPLPLMEDVDLVRRVGRRRLTQLPVDAFTSAERWRGDGWLRRSARNLACLAAYCAGATPERIVRLYG